MNQQESKDLIEKVGGLEAAQAIINRAPYWLSYYVTEGQHKGQYGSSDGVFADGFFDDTVTPFPPPHIKLSDLRTAITERQQAAVDKAKIKNGSWVVVNEQGEYLYVATHIQDGLLWIDSFASHGDAWELIQHQEQRPHPCATCPNVGHKACCCEVA